MKQLVASLLLCLSVSASAFDLKPDGSMVLLPQEQAILNQCQAQGGGCFIVSREVIQNYAQRYADSQVAELQAEVRERFERAVADEARNVAAKICKNAV